MKRGLVAGLAAAAGIFVAGGAALYLSQKGDELPAPPVSTETVSPAKTSEKPHKTEIVYESVHEEIPHNPAEPYNDLSYMQPPAMDPDAQPRTYWERDFDSMYQMPPGYELDGVQLTKRGIELKGLGDDEVPHPRKGVLLSPPELMEFSWNGIAPMWKQLVPERTSLTIEIAASTDGKDWTDWMMVEADDEVQVSETYPDGSPNPNFGFIVSGMFFGTADLWEFTRYRVTLYSETEESPVLEAYRLYVIDSTLGQGQPGVVNNFKDLGSGDPETATQ